MGLIDSIVDGIERGINAGRRDALPEWAQNMDLTTDERNQILAQEHNYQFQSAEAEKARQWQEDFYKEFQSPSAMVEQYKSAGLNPMSIAGKVGGNTPPSASAPSGGNTFKPSTHQGIDNTIMSVVQAVLGMEQQALAVKTQKEDLEYKRLELQTRKDIAQMQIDAQTSSQDKSLGLDKYKFDKTHQLELDKFVQSQALTDAQIDMIQSQIANIDQDTLTKAIDRQIRDKDNQLKDLDLKKALRESGVSDKFFDALDYDPRFSWSIATQAFLDASTQTAKVVDKSAENLSRKLSEWDSNKTAYGIAFLKDLFDTTKKWRERYGL